MDRTPGHLSTQLVTKFPGLRIKILSMGDAGVGKSCLIKRYCENKFIQDYIATIGIDYGVKTVSVDDEEVKVNFWDVAGDPVYFEIRNEFYKDTHVVILVYDVCNQSSFDSLNRWMDELRNYCPSEPLIFLVATKTDKENRKVTREQGEQVAKKMGLSYWETSSKTGDGVMEMWESLWDGVVTKLQGTS
ncbi:DnaJ sub C member 27 [Gaertneriomyces sp. JEL0708]|nr:DnaJ sub C member 27 [Gaertneriomyces sp. JEL0708]